MRVRYLAAVSLIAMSASGCTVLKSREAPPPEAVRSAHEAAQRADINPGYKTGSFKIPTGSTAGLNEILAKTAAAPKKQAPKDGEDRLRSPAMQDAALSYGARSGLAHTTREINKLLERQSAQLSQTYNFQKLMIQGPDGVMVNPPIIVEARESWESSDAGKTLRIADTVYEIIEQSRFTSVTPMWQNYLIAHFDEAETPPDALLPRDASEKANWQKWVTEGWTRGQEQAEETFQANLDRLNRDFNGMVRYRILLEEGKVSAPRLAGADLGNTGTGQDMRVNDRAIRITEDPSLQINPRGWSASATTTDEQGEVKGPAPTPVAAPAPAPRKPTRPAARPVPKPPSKPVDEATTGGTGRF